MRDRPKGVAAWDKRQDGIWSPFNIQKPAGLADEFYFKPCVMMIFSATLMRAVVIAVARSAAISTGCEINERMDK